jgi:hypothetical protein
MRFLLQAALADNLWAWHKAAQRFAALVQRQVVPLELV